MFWMRAYPLRGQVGGGWALAFESFLGPVKWHRADRRVPFGAHIGGCGDPPPQNRLSADAWDVYVRKMLRFETATVCSRTCVVYIISSYVMKLMKVMKFLHYLSLTLK